MLGADADAYDVGGNEAQRGDTGEETQDARRPQRPGAAQHRIDQAFLDGDLDALRDFGGEGPALLDGGEDRFVDRTALQRAAQRVGGGDGILDREVDADAADG